MRIGDVQAVVAIVIALGLGLTAALLVASLIFRKKTQHAAVQLSSHPGKSLMLGAFSAVLGIGIGLALMQGGGVAMFLGWVLLLGTFLIALIGCAGLMQVTAERIQQVSPSPSPFAGHVKAASLLVLAGFLPAFGWFLLFPLQLFAGLGAGASAVFSRRRAVVEQPLPQAQGQ